MENHAKNDHETPALMHENDDRQSLQTAEDLVAPGIPIVRASTPRPLSYAPTTTAAASRQEQEETVFVANFPAQAPVAPPLPEETQQEPISKDVPVILSTPEAEKDDDNEFVWLFEYGLEMEPAYLNSPERLNGLAIRYGPGKLSGYELRGIELLNGRIAPTLVKCANQDNEVWGMLYRVPQRLLAREGAAPSALDNAHPTPAFASVQVRVQETYRKRSIECITYLASAQVTQAFAVISAEQHRLDSFYARQLLRIGKQQGLPASYLEELASFNVTTENDPIMPEKAQGQPQGEQDTEPLPTLVHGSMRKAVLSDTKPGAQAMQPVRWLFALALYLVLLLLATLVLAVMQSLGYWGQIFVAGFMPLGVPWYVLLYGLLGGCISCMTALGQLAESRRSNYSRGRRHFPGTTQPLHSFVAITWFARPYLGAILAALAYFILNSGLFLLSIEPSQRYAMYAVVGVIAGLSEGRIFFRQQTNP